MKKNLLLFILLVSSSILFAQESTINVKGTKKFRDTDKTIKIYFKDEFKKNLVDSIFIADDNTFEKNVTLPNPGVYILECRKTETVAFWGENENIEVHFSGRDMSQKISVVRYEYIHIYNSGRNNELMNLVSFFDWSNYQQRSNFGKEYRLAMNSSSDEWKAYVEDGDERIVAANSLYINYLAEYFGDRNSALTLLPRLKDDELKHKIINHFEKNNPNYPAFLQYKKDAAEKKEVMSHLAVGVKAPSFSYFAPDGKTKIGTEDFKGKYLLIDFWASWCGPCKASIPLLKELYAQYNSKGFEILSVSIDERMDWWKKTMEAEDMPWAQVCTPDVGKEVMKNYQFNAIPHLVLLDKEGKIIARDIMAKKLEEVLKNNIK